MLSSACRRAENETFNLKFIQPSWPCMPQNGVAGPVNSPRLVLTRKMRIGATAEECAGISHMVTSRSSRRSSSQSCFPMSGAVWSVVVTSKKKTALTNSQLNFFCLTLRLVALGPAKTLFPIHFPSLLLELSKYHNFRCCVVERKEGPPATTQLQSHLEIGPIHESRAYR